MSFRVRMVTVCCETDGRGIDFLFPVAMHFYLVIYVVDKYTVDFLLSHIIYIGSYSISAGKAIFLDFTKGLLFCIPLSLHLFAIFSILARQVLDWAPYLRLCTDRISK